MSRVTRVALIAVASVLLVPTTARAQQPGADMPMMKPHLLTYVGFDELEIAATGEERVAEYDGEFWYGGDYHRLWLKAAGEHDVDGSEGVVEVQALYSRTLSPFWNLQTGVRLDQAYGDRERARGHLGIGFEGLAPYWFEVEAFAWVSDAGDVSASLEASWDLLLTQRLILETEAETDFAIHAVESWGVGRGVNEIELGTRLRYEFVREFAPYIGYSWSRSVGHTADLARAAGEEASHGAVVIGLHWWW